MYCEAGLLPLNRQPESENKASTISLDQGLIARNNTVTNMAALPVLVREGMVPRDRALLRRPGREEGDALCSRGPR